ncbi:hypothetical protein DFH28DRAFT_979465 [Melampsora americana]|nr:hypothetical protein DFH28DRAFT_979465 [Melampsora americana]
MRSTLLLACFLSFISFVVTEQLIGQSPVTLLTSRSYDEFSPIEQKDDQSAHSLVKRDKRDDDLRRKRWQKNDPHSRVKCPDDHGGNFVLVKKDCHLAAYHLAVNGLSYSECGTCAVVVTDKNRSLKKVSLTCSEAQSGVDFIFKVRCYKQSNVPFPKFSSPEEFGLTTQASVHHTSCQALIRHDKGTRKSSCKYHQ